MPRQEKNIVPFRKPSVERRIGGFRVRFPNAMQCNGVVYMTKAAKTPEKTNKPVKLGNYRIEAHNMTC